MTCSILAKEVTMTRLLSPINILLILAVFALFIYGMMTIPGDQLVPVHWNIYGEVDYTIAAEWALWIGPLEVVVALGAFWLARTRLPKDEFAAGQALVTVSVSIALAAGLFVQSIVVFGAQGALFDVPQLAAVFIGLVMLILGNYLPKSQTNRFAGVRLPWTMSSESVWARTHHFAGKCFMLAGLLIVLVGLINLGGPAILLLTLGCVFLAVLATVIYSYSIRENAKVEKAN